MHEIFLCYDEHDREIASQACKLLEDNQIDCWMKDRDSDVSDVVMSVMNAIRKCRLFVLILSKHAVVSNFVSTEVDIAFSDSIPMICLNVDGVRELKGLEFFIHNTQILDGSSNLNKGFESMVADSCKVLGRKPIKTKPDVEFKVKKQPKTKKSQGLFGRLFGKGKDKKPIKNDDEFVYGSDSLRRPFDAYMGDEDYIFISYAHKDAELIFPEIKRFHDEGYPIWYDQGLTAGQEWDEEIEEFLLDCSLLVVFVSKNSMASSNVVDEIKLALAEDIDIVPIYLEDAKLARGLKLRLSQKHAIMKYSLHDDDYIDACFKAFESAKIPKIR